MKKTVRLNFEFPREHYPYLKMVCAQKGLSLKDFASALLIREIVDYEDERLAKRAKQRLKEMDMGENIDFSDASKLAGWESAKDV